jgi:hypothetical protein
MIDNVRSLRFGLITLAVLVAMVAFPMTSGAQLPGAIYTTNSSGTIVNGSLFADKTLVYLNGGPQNKNAAGLPDGTYYFQVTDPSGAQLLSADDITCRQIIVQDQRFLGAPATTPASCTTGLHVNGTYNDASGGTPVQLCPAANPLRTDNLVNATSFDASNWCDTTSNNGGVYKVWLTPIDDYNHCSNDTSPRVYGFCDVDSKTKTFKVRNQNSAYVTVCKFNDLDGNGSQDTGEPMISGWPITATGVDLADSNGLGAVNAQTDDSGCASFSVSDFKTAGGVVTLTEGLEDGWDQTAPAVGTFTVSDGAGDGKSISIEVAPNAGTPSTNFETLTLSAGDQVNAPNFGNTCVADSCGGNTIQLTVTKTASPSLTRTYGWDITKTVDTPTVYSVNGGTSNAANYTVSVTHDIGTDSGWQATGTITISNPSLVPISGVTVTDAVDNGGSCSIDYPAGVTPPLTIPAATDVNTPGTMSLPYTCTYSALPSKGTNTAKASWDDNGPVTASGTADVDFSGAAINVVDGTVNVADSLDNGTPTALGSVSYTDDSPKTFKYSHTFTDPAGTCTTHQNTATFTSTTLNSKTTGSSSQTVKDCQGEDLTVTKTATPAFSSDITKTGPASPVEVAGSSYTLNYTIKVTEKDWQVGGNITVTNPNDWEDVQVTLSDVLSGATCVVNGGTTTITVNRGSFATVSYACTFASAPAVSSSNTATATWNSGTYNTPHGSASSGAVKYTFPSLTVTDAFNGATVACSATVKTNCVKTLGTITTPIALTTYTDSYTVSNLPAGGCNTYPNTASITGGPSSTVNEQVCNTKTGALTMGFWQNNNGQGIIKSYCGGSSLSSWLAQFNAFKDDTATSCSNEATYVYNIIKAAACTSSTNTCNSMLRAQMLATALDVYFSTPGLGGNRIAPYNGNVNVTGGLGAVAINLSAIHPCADGSGGATCTSGSEDTRPEFGIAPPCLGTTVGQMLAYGNHLSAINGSPVSTANTGANWYLQNKGRQVPAKDSFDDFNNQIAPIAPSSCIPSF